MTRTRYFDGGENHNSNPNCWLHPCRIDDQWHLVHHPELATREPDYFQRVLAFAGRLGFRLLADRRGSQSDDRYRNRRRAWLPMIVLSAAINGPANAGEPGETAPSVQTQLRAVNPRTALTSEVLPQSNETARLFATGETRSHPRWANRIYDILRARWSPSTADPGHLRSDLIKMANYFSHYPAVRELFAELDNWEWQLQYDRHNFETQIEGRGWRINTVTVLFDPRAAAQFKFHRACHDKRPHCVASPADVLLHELLHVRAVLSDPQAFIASGGLGSMLYPYEHEHQTIAQEAQLYRDMSERDRRPRPLRSEHTGRSVLVACVTCLE